MNSRCQVDLIDMQSNTDGDFKFIMVYHLTKFVQLRALTSKRAVEVAYKLLDIFCIFGAPSCKSCNRRVVFDVERSENSTWQTSP